MFNFYLFFSLKKMPSHAILGVGFNTNNWCCNVNRLRGQATSQQPSEGIVVQIARAHNLLLQ